MVSKIINYRNLWQQNITFWRVGENAVPNLYHNVTNWRNERIWESL